MPSRAHRLVHNVRVIRPAAAVTGIAAGVLLLAGCSGSSSSSPSASGTATHGTGSTHGSTPPSAPPSSPSGSGTTSSLPVPGGVKLTPQGTKLKLPQTATVAWRPTQKRVGVADLGVTRIDKVPISAFHAFRLDPVTKNSTPYYVHVKVKNIGRSNLSHVPIPLYVLEHNTLLEPSTFEAVFPACPSRPLPSGFTHGKTTTACLVYFVPRHGTLDAVSYRPTQDFVAITWTGKVTKPQSHSKQPAKHHTKQKH
jgi:hypothetical protein